MANSVAPRIGYGAQLWIDFIDGNGYIQQPRVISIKVPEPEITKVNASNLQSVDYFKESIPGMIGHADLSFELQYHESGYAALLALAYSRVIAGFKVVSQTNGEYYTFTAYIAKGPTQEYKDEDLVVMKLDACISSLGITGTLGSSASGE